MDSSDGEKISKRSKKTQEESSSDSGDVLQPTWVRRLIRFSDEMDRVLLDNRPYLLCHVGILFWVILFVKSR